MQISNFKTLRKSDFVSWFCFHLWMWKLLFGWSQILNFGCLFSTSFKWKSNVRSEWTCSLYFPWHTDFNLRSAKTRKWTFGVTFKNAFLHEFHNHRCFWLMKIPNFFTLLWIMRKGWWQFLFSPTSIFYSLALKFTKFHLCWTNSFVNLLSSFDSSLRIYYFCMISSFE